MPPKSFPLCTIVAAFLLATGALHAQTGSEFTITKIEPTFIESPTFSGVRYDKRGAKSKNWLEVEITFDYTPKKVTDKYADEITVNYYIYLKNQSSEFPKGAVLTGSVTHLTVPAEKNMHSVVYVSPRALERLFDGKVPTAAAAAIVDIGVTISKQGQTVAEMSLKGRGAWWATYPQTPGFVLNKSETPFAPLAWDYYEAIKPKSGG